MEAFKSENTASLNIAQNQLHELLQEHFEVLMSFITFCSLSYRTEEHPNDSEYDFEVSIVLHGLTEIDIATLSQDQNIASPFAASSSIPVKGSPGLHTSQRCISQLLLSGGITDDDTLLQYFTITFAIVVTDHSLNVLWESIFQTTKWKSPRFCRRYERWQKCATRTLYIHWHNLSTLKFWINRTA